MLKIMLVDDVQISNFIMKTMISKLPGKYQVTDFTHPTVALDQIQQVNPDLIFLDLNMPGMDGWMFLETMMIRKLEQQVIILTSSINEIDEQRATFFRNVKAFLVKPVDKTNLEAVVIKALENTSSQIN